MNVGPSWRSIAVLAAVIILVIKGVDTPREEGVSQIEWSLARVQGHDAR